MNSYKTENFVSSKKIRKTYLLLLLQPLKLFENRYLIPRQRRQKLVRSPQVQGCDVVINLGKTEVDPQGIETTSKKLQQLSLWKKIRFNWVFN